MFSGGERYPLLIDENGIPLWYPSLYATTQLRNASKAANTIASSLSAIRHLLVWSERQGIDLLARFAARQFLTTQEIESLRSFAQHKVGARVERNGRLSRPRNVERVYGVIGASDPRVRTETQYIRLTYMAAYLQWLAVRLIEREAGGVDGDAHMQIKRMISGIHARRPQKVRASQLRARRGLSAPQRERLLSLVEPDAPDNPFAPDVRVRNQLIVHLLYYLGMRQGELLALQVLDVDFEENTLLIARRHDEQGDPRADQPVAKTMDRRVPISDQLAKMIHDYVLRERRQWPAARRHHYLFVTQKAGPHAGLPLTKKSLYKVFASLREAASGELDGLCAHVLRHTWNDRFSEHCDARTTPQAEEEKMRSYLMGWREGSGTSTTYTKRHTANKAMEAALQLQRETT